MGAARKVKSKDLFPTIFSRHAEAYERRLDQIMARGEARGRQRVIALIQARPGMRILDLACGPGTLTRRFADQVGPVGEVVGVDLAPGMLEVARAAGIPNARFEVMDIERLEFPDATFDATACGHGLHFVPNLDIALSEARRVTRPGGPFAASIPAGSRQQRPWMLVEEVVDRRLPPAPKAIDQQATRAIVLDVAAFRQAALSAGFKEARVEVIQEVVHWSSAEQLVSMFVSWWDCASRMERLSPDDRQTFTEEAVTALRRSYPGPIETMEANHVLFAIA